MVFKNDVPDVTGVFIKLFADNAKINAVVSNQVDVNKVQNSLNRAIISADVWKIVFT